MRATADLSRVTAAIDAAKLSAEATRYAPALKLAQRVLADSTLQTREVVMISDFQRSGWVRDENLRLPEGTMFKPVPITDAQPANLTVSNVLPQRSMFSGQERVTRRGQRHQPRAGGGEQRAGASRARRPFGRNADGHGAAGRARLGDVPTVHAGSGVYARHRAHRRRRAEAGQRVSFRRVAGAAIAGPARGALTRTARGELLPAESPRARDRACLPGGRAPG